MNGTGMLGIKHSSETRKKMSLAHSGIPKAPFSKEHRRNIGLSQIGRKPSKETKEKMRLSHMGIPAWNKGISLSDEVRKKMSLAQVGKKRSEDTKRILSISKSGKNHPMFGKHVSKEIKRKMSEAHKGSRNWNWKGGVTPLTKQIRHCFKMRQWRSDVFTRDDFTCSECGSRGCYLEAHHVKSFSQIMTENKIENNEQAQNCAELWNLNNGITLCLRCHNKINKHRKTSHLENK